MTSSSLFKEIDYLNNEIENCKGMLDKTGKKKICPPNCYCDKRIGLENKNYVTSTRKKTSTATVTKMDIAPRCTQEMESSSRVKNNIRRDPIRPNTTQGENYNENKSPCFTKFKRSTTQATTNCSREDNHTSGDNGTEPVKLPKCQHLRNQPSWSAILQQSNEKKDFKENVVPNYDNNKGTYIPKASTSNSSVRSAALETVPVYMKNKGTQYEEIHLPKEKYFHHNDPLNTVRYIIMNMKSKIKDDPDPSLGSMLDEMEIVLRKIPLDRGDCQEVGNFSKKFRNSFERDLSPKPDFHKQTSREILEATYRELETTCAKLKKERDSAILRASQKSTELVESMRRELETKRKLNETNSKIKEMSAKLETYTKSMEGLTDHVKRLQSENKDMERIRGQVTQLSNMMRDVTQENKNLLTDLQLVTIERNKLEVALAIKEQDLEKKTKELENLSQLLIEKNQLSKTNHYNKTAKMNQDISNKVQSFNRFRNESPDSPQLVSSSPNSSSSESILRERLNSWVAFSTITDTDKAPANDQQNLSPERQNIRSIRDESAIVASTSNNQPSSYTKMFQPSVRTEKRPNFNKIENLKEEIRRMFTEMRELAQDVPSIPIVEFSAMGDSSDMNWSEVSNTVNSYESVSDLQSSDLNKFLNKNKLK